MKKSVSILVIFLLLCFVTAAFADEIFEPAPTAEPGLADRLASSFSAFQWRSSRQAPLGIWITLTLAPCLMFAALLIPFRKNADANTAEAGSALWQWSEGRENHSLRFSYTSHVPGGFFYSNLVGSRGASVQNIGVVCLNGTQRSAAAVEAMTNEWKKRIKTVSGAREIPAALEKETGAIENGALLRLSGGSLYWAVKGNVQLQLLRRGEVYRINRPEDGLVKSVLPFPLEADDAIRLCPQTETPEASEFALIRIEEKE